MIALGQWDQAHHKLAAVGAHVQTVKDSKRRQGLIEKVNRLNDKVVNREKNGRSAASVKSLGVRGRLVQRSIGVSPAIIPGHVGIGLRVVGRLVRTHGAVDQ